MNKLNCFLLSLSLSFFCLTALADTIAKEDTTLPAPEGVLTVDQIPPLYTLAAPNQN